MDRSWVGMKLQVVDEGNFFEIMPNFAKVRGPYMQRL